MKETFLNNKNNLNRHANIVIKYVKSYFDSLYKNQIVFSEKLKKINLETTKNNNSTLYFIIISVFTILILSTIFYANHLSKRISKKESIAYDKGIKTASNHINSFFKGNPKARQAYDKWKINNGFISKQL